MQLPQTLRFAKPRSIHSTKFRAIAPISASSGMSTLDGNHWQSTDWLIDLQIGWHPCKGRNWNPNLNELRRRFAKFWGSLTPEINCFFWGQSFSSTWTMSILLFRGLIVGCLMTLLLHSGLVSDNIDALRDLEWNLLSETFVKSVNLAHVDLIF